MLPNGRSIVLERQPGADPQGFIGLEDEVDQHWDRLFMGAVLSTVIGIGAELGSNANDSAIASALRQGSSNSLSHRSANHTTQPQYPADPHRPPGVSGAGDHQSRPRPHSLPGLKDRARRSGRLYRR
jgi:hypothetical protein